MRDAKNLADELRRIDGRGYKAYKDIRGSHDLGDMVLHIDHVQGDPFASPSKLCVEINRKTAGLPSDLDPSAPARLGLEDFVRRAFARAIGEVKGVRSGSRGMGKSGLIEIDPGGQEVLKRTALVATDETVEARFTLGLPARGRTVLGRQASAMLLDEVPAIARASLFMKALDRGALEEHIGCVVDWHALRDAVREAGLVAFVADGAVLPRLSGVDQRPLTGPDVTAFGSPPELAAEFDLPSGKKVSGMGVPAGVTLIVGGGFHGKSTLLNALALGVYPHVPGDGRELVAADAAAVKVRAEDGRRVEGVNISAFIDNLPGGKDTKSFRTDNASGSTSQAANIVEALEMGARALLVDEDTSAANFMIRDRRMQMLVAKPDEPITPFVDRAREIRERFGCSVVMVAGGSGDYFDVADTVIRMRDYQPEEVTGRAREIARERPTGREAEDPDPMAPPASRRPLPESFDPGRGKREVKIGAKGLREVHFGKTVVDLSYVEQMTDPSQTRMVGELIHLFSRRYLDRGGLREGMEEMMAELRERGPDAASPVRRGDLAMPRSFETAAAVNRMRTLKVK